MLFRLLCLVFLSSSFIACDDGPILNAVGSYSDVAILTSTPLLPAATTLQRQLAQQVEYSLRPEPMLVVDIFDMRDKNDAAKYKNVIVIGIVGGKDDSSRELQRQLSGENMKGIAPRELYLATREDVYAGNQNVLFLAGVERNLMQSAIQGQAAALRGQIEASNRERVREYLFSLGHNVPVEDQIRRVGGFRLQVPEGYEGTRFFEGEESGSIEIAARNPTRTVAVMWRGAIEDAAVLEDQAALLEQRRHWGEIYLEEELQDAGGYTWSTVSFMGAELPMLAGYWSGETYGGPFRSIFYYDESSKRLYGINWLCYAPNLPKHIYMRETQAIAETFEPRQ